MGMYKVCPHCGHKVDYYKQCECIDKYKKATYKLYKANRKDKKEQKIYSSDTWIRCRDNVRTHYLGFCVVCWYKNKQKNNNESIDAYLTHHIIEMKDDYELRLEESNLIPLCTSCHRKIHYYYDKDIKSKIKAQEYLREAIKEFNLEFY